MPSMPSLFKPPGSRSKTDRNREADLRRGSARQRGYDSKWDKARKAFLGAHPLCEYCAGEGRVAPATLVDHLYPQQTYPGTFWASHWWVPSCKPCHDGPKQAAERSGRVALDDLARHLGRPVMPPGGLETLSRPAPGPVG